MNSEDFLKWLLATLAGLMFMTGTFGYTLTYDVTQNGTEPTPIVLPTLTPFPTPTQEVFNGDSPLPPVESCLGVVLVEVLNTRLCSPSFVGDPLTCIRGTPYKRGERVSIDTTRQLHSSDGGILFAAVKNSNAYVAVWSGSEVYINQACIASP